jgi:hypothetical protein
MSKQNPILGEIIIQANGKPAILLSKGSSADKAKVLSMNAAGMRRDGEGGSPFGQVEIDLTDAVWGEMTMGGLEVGNIVRIKKEDHEHCGKSGRLTSVPSKVFPFYLMSINSDVPGDGPVGTYATAEHLNLEFVSEGDALPEDVTEADIIASANPAMMFYLAGVRTDRGVLTGEDVVAVPPDSIHPVGSFVQVADPSVPAKDGMLGEVVGTPGMREDQRYKVRLVDGQSYFTTKHQELVPMSM